ncbi:hypothetical protein DFH28DRAFT_219246 [Melampsora americana]|nr:hypothetical protein DFH28DRAFT_219246 [Melampsora americana]
MGAYRIEYSPNARAQCNGKKPCKGTKIPKGEIRVGAWVVFREHGSFKWRHWGCCTEAIFENLSTELDGKIEELDGFEDLTPEDQTKIKTAFEVGHVDPADIPASAITSHEEGEGDEEQKVKPKKRKKAVAKKGAAKSENGEVQDDVIEDEEDLPKQKKKRAPAKKLLEVDNENIENADKDAAPKKKRAYNKKKKVEVATGVSGSD